MSEGPTGSDPGQQRGSDLSDLRSRLAALHGSVERLGREEDPVPPPAEAPGPYPYSDPAQQAPQEPADEQAPPSVPSPYADAPAPPEQEWGQNPYAAEPVPPPAEQPQVDAYGYPVAPAPLPADPYRPAPAATNGQGEQEAGAAAIDANIAILDIGPFADLIELRHFEEAVARLEAVRDVRVRRFGHGRAIIELGLAGPYAIGRELFRLGRPMEVGPGPEGEVIVDFTDVPDPLVEPAEDAPVAAEATEGEPASAESATADEENV